MIVLRYEKKYPFSMVSHIDLLRAFGRILNRADVRVGCSKGFNPHMNLYFSPPLGLGTESECELCVIDTDDTFDLSRFNAVAPKGLKATKCFSVEKNPNLAATVTWAEYLAQGEGLGALADATCLTQAECLLPIKRRDKTEEKDVAPLIRYVKKEGENALRFCLACGNVNLKADVFLNGLMQKEGKFFPVQSVCKTAMFLQNGENAESSLR